MTAHPEIDCTSAALGRRVCQGWSKSPVWVLATDPLGPVV